MNHNLLTERIAQCQQGQAEAFTWLVAEYGPRLYGYFVRQAGSTGDAEDLLQETFVKVVAHIKDYRHQGRFEAWLFRLAANLLRDRGRRQRRQLQSLGKLMPLADPATDGPTVASPQAGPSEQAQLAEFRDRLQAALQQLPQLDREIILLRYYGGLSFKEIAQHLDLPLGTALTKVHRGLKHLQRILGDHEELETTHTTGT